jgi:uncharacterized membrane protein YfcA
MVITDPTFWLAAIIAVIALGLSKGGFSGVGTIAAPLLALAVPPLQALAILLPILLVQDAVTIWAYRRTFDRWNLAVLIPGQLIGAGIGWLIAAHVDDAQVRIAVGVIAVAFVLNHWFGPAPKEQTTRPPTAKGVIWGAVSGVASFLANTGGPALQAFLLPQRMPVATFVGTLSILFASANAMKIVPYYALGQMTAENMVTALALLPLAVASNLAGVWLVRRTPTAVFYRVTHVLVLLIGLELIRNGAVALWRG